MESNVKYRQISNSRATLYFQLIYLKNFNHLSVGKPHNCLCEEFVIFFFAKAMTCCNLIGGHIDQTNRSQDF